MHHPKFTGHGEKAVENVRDSETYYLRAGTTTKEGKITWH
jgi:hypothetical protein